MTTFSPVPVSSFCRGISDLIERAECRLVRDPAEREAVFRLRYAAYHREGALPPNAPTIFEDRFDAEANAATFAIYIDGRLSSAIRLHVVDAATPDHPGLHVFPDYLWPAIRAGDVMIDPTRFVVDAASSHRFPKLSYVTVRIAWMASEWFGADKLLATVRLEHQAFYKRLFGHRVVCDARPYPTLTKPLSLMVLDYPAERERVLRRYPFFRSTKAERAMLFGSWGKATPAVVANGIPKVA